MSLTIPWMTRNKNTYNEPLEDLSCNQCGKRISVGDTYYYYHDNWDERYSFCSEGCAAKFFVDQELKNDTWN